MKTAWGAVVVDSLIVLGSFWMCYYFNNWHFVWCIFFIGITGGYIKKPEETE